MNQFFVRYEQLTEITLFGNRAIKTVYKAKQRCRVVHRPEMRKYGVLWSEMNGN